MVDLLWAGILSILIGEVNNLNLRPLPTLATSWTSIILLYRDSYTNLSSLVAKKTIKNIYQLVPSYMVQYGSLVGLVSINLYLPIGL